MSGSELEAVARDALARYALPDAELALLRTTNNAVFDVRTDGGRFVLRVHRPHYRSVAHTRSELAFLEHVDERLRGSAVAVPRPVRARDGELVVTARGWHCDALTWVGGRVLKPGRGLGPGATRLLGEALGRIHAAAVEFQPPPDFDVPTWDADAMFTAASPFRPERLEEYLPPGDRALFRHVVARTREVFAVLDERPDSRGLVHHDFILVNCHFAGPASRRQVGVLDFDDLGWGYFLYDLAPLLGNLADYPDRYARLRGAFLDGYRSVRALPPELEVHLPVLMAARHASACAWVVGIHQTKGTGPPLEEHVAIRMELMRACLALPY